MDSKAPLLTLSVSPTNGNSANDLLARFHPILKELGFGNFEKLESWLYSASKPGESIFRAADVVFAQVDGETLHINFEGESIFGLASIETLLKEISRINRLRSRTSWTQLQECVSQQLALHWFASFGRFYNWNFSNQTD